MSISHAACMGAVAWEALHACGAMWEAPSYPLSPQGGIVSSTDYEDYAQPFNESYCPNVSYHHRVLNDGAQSMHAPVTSHYRMAVVHHQVSHHASTVAGAIQTAECYARPLSAHFMSATRVCLGEIVPGP